MLPVGRRYFTFAVFLLSHTSWFIYCRYTAIFAM